MITCPTCGAQNDPANRFCDQCGTRLESTAAPEAPVTPDQPTAAAMTCPTCGAAVVPGEAFCDTCGAALSAPTLATAAPAVNDAPTIAAPPPASSSGTITCPACGQQNLADARYCDNCGAELAPAASPDDTTMVVPPAVETAPQPDDATVVAPPAEEAAPAPPAESRPDDTTVVIPPPAAEEPPAEAAPSDTTATPAPVSEEPVTAPPAETEPPSPPATGDATMVTPPAEPTGEPPVAPAPTAPESSAPPAVEPPVESAPAAEPPPVSPAPDAERQRLEELAAAHRETVSQYEQMLSRYPAGAAPAFLTAGLDEARNALAQAEADLAALPVTPIGPDPAEVQRLEELAAAHRETVSQYEQMLSRYPASAAPAFLTAGLDEARNALTQAEADLATLLGGQAAAAPAMPAAPPPAAEPVAPVPSAVPAPEAAAPPPAPAGARIVLVDGGHELMLPTGKTVIIVGREDPVSNIFPEIDMTPFGGESGGVSRQHARLDLAGGQWTVTDLNSTNYTRVEGNRIEPNTPTPIHDGSRLQFGRIAVIFHT